MARDDKNPDLRLSPEAFCRGGRDARFHEARFVVILFMEQLTLKMRVEAAMMHRKVMKSANGSARSMLCTITSRQDKYGRGCQILRAHSQERLAENAATIRPIGHSVLESSNAKYPPE
eukprot:6198983-Pleurochrysis_carterae.AAC.6